MNGLQFKIYESKSCAIDFNDNGYGPMSRLITIKQLPMSIMK